MLSIFRTLVSRRPFCLTLWVRSTSLQTVPLLICSHMSYAVIWSMSSLMYHVYMGKQMFSCTTESKFKCAPWLTKGWLFCTQSEAGRPLVDYCVRPSGTSLRTVVSSLVPIAGSMANMCEAQRGTSDTITKRWKAMECCFSGTDGWVVGVSGSLRMYGGWSVVNHGSTRTCCKCNRQGFRQSLVQHSQWRLLVILLLL